MLTLTLALLLAQTQPAVRRSAPAADDPGMVVRQAGTASVTCTNCQMAFTPDGGSIGSVTQGRALDGGTGWGVYIEGGTLSVSSSTTFDGGSIGYLRMPDGGALEVYTVNAGSSGGGWVPDGGFVGLVGLADGGGVFVTNASLTVTGPLTDAQLRASAVPVSAASLPLPSGAATEATLSTRAADSTITARLNTLGQKTAANSTPVVLASDQTSIPVTDNGGSLTVDGTVAVSGTVTTSGTTTAAQGTPAATASRWPVQLTDGTDLAQVSAGGAVLVDGSGATQPVSGSVTVTQATGTNLHVVVDTAPTTTVTGTVAATQSGTWNITNVSGTVSLPTGAATAANQTTLGSQTTKLNDGTDTALISAAGALLVDGSATTQPVSGTVGVSGTVTVSGTVDTELPAAAALADATANPTITSAGALNLLFNGTTWDRMRGDTTNGLLVNVSHSFLLAATFTGRCAAGAALSDNFANPTTTQTGAMNMLWDGATWDRAPGTSTDGMLVNLGANNDVTITSGTVTANAGTGNFATNLAQYGGVAVSATNGLHVQPGTGASFTVAQATASSLRAQTASEGAVGSAVPATASLMGASDGTNLRAPKVFDLDASATTPDWVLGTQLRVGAWGASQPVSYAQSSWGNIDIAVYSDPKLSATPTTTAVSCATTATAAPASLLSSRTTVTFVNNSAVTIYLGGSAVTTANGIPLLPGASFTDDVAASPYYCRVASGTADLRVLEN